MIVLISLAAAVFLGLILVAIIAPLAPAFTIKLLELCRIYEPGRLTTSKGTDRSGGEYEGRTTIVYCYHLPDGGIRGENARIFGWMALLSVGLMLVLALVLVPLVVMSAVP